MSGGGSGTRHVCRRREHMPRTPPGTNHHHHNNKPTQTHLLQLKLSPAADVGIGVERRSDATSNGGGIHCGQAVGPTIASKALRSDGRYEWEKRPEARRVVVVEGSGSRKNLGQNLVALQGRQGPRNGGAEGSVGSGRFTLCCEALPLSAQPAAQLPGCSGKGPSSCLRPGATGTYL